MHTQSDLFDPDPVPPAPPAPPPDPEPETAADAGEPCDAIEPLAAPCGFRNCRNEPCKRLASRPLLIDGIQLIHRKIPILHCDPACWRDVDPADATAETDRQVAPEDDFADRDDPGPEAPPDYEDWSRWERADDDGFAAGEAGEGEEGRG